MLLLRLKLIVRPNKIAAVFFLMLLATCADDSKLLRR